MTNNSFRIKNSRNEQATIWPIGNNTYFCSIKWDDEASTMTVSKSAVDSLVECGEWNIVQEYKLPNKFKFVTDVCEDHDGNVYTCTIPEDSSNNATITLEGEDGNAHIEALYYRAAVQKYVENGTWKIIEEEDEQEPDLMNYLYEIIRSGSDEKDYSENTNISTLTVNIDINVEELKKELETMQEMSAGILDDIRKFTGASKHYFVIEKGQMNIYHADSSIPYTCQSEDDIVTVMNAIETLDNFTAE